MHISYNGLYSFKIVAKVDGRGSDDITILFSPFKSLNKLKFTKVKSDLVLFSSDKCKVNNYEGFKGDPLVLDSAGEYVKNGVAISGFETCADYSGGKIRGKNVAYVLDVENKKIVYLGMLGRELDSDELEQVIDADVLFLPVGDKLGIDGRTAEVIARKISPKIIIPMFYDDNKKIELENIRSSEDFCNNIGSCPAESIEKLLITDKELENKQMEVVMLSIN